MVIYFLDHLANRPPYIYSNPTIAELKNELYHINMKNIGILEILHRQINLEIHTFI